MSEISGAYIHPDFGSNYTDYGTLYPMGIPFEVVPSTQPLVDVDFSDGYYTQTDFGSQGNSVTFQGEYPIPPLGWTIIEGGGVDLGDQHILVLQQGTCRLWELYHASFTDSTNLTATSGAIFNTSSNSMRPDEWTSADAAGLPIMPLLVKYDEVQSSDPITHAFRFTISSVAGYKWPASHPVSSPTKNGIPLGARFRVKSSYTPSPTVFSPRNIKVIDALKTYGMILADVGSNWYISGQHSDFWDGDEQGLKSLPTSAFEAVDDTCMQVAADSYQAASTCADTTAPSTGAPVVSSTTHSPTSESPTSLRPTTVAPSSKAPTSQAPTSQAPSSRSPSVEAAPTTLRPSTHVPTSQKPTSQKPTSQKPTTQKPTSQKATSQKPTTHKPTTHKPTLLTATRHGRV